LLGGLQDGAIEQSMDLQGSIRFTRRLVEYDVYTFIRIDTCTW
jgi:hypothetical protein